MNVFLNNDCIETKDNISLVQLLQQSGYSEKKGIAVAINNQVVRKDAWHTAALNENDKVLIISATKGG